MKFLIDECLSIDLVSLANKAGYEAQHIVRIGLAGKKDWEIVRYVGKTDFVLVTNNADDYRKLYAKEPLHAGLVIIIPNVGRAEQRRLFNRALDKLGELGEPINRVLEVDVECEEVIFDFYDLPAAPL